MVKVKVTLADATENEGNDKIGIDSYVEVGTYQGGRPLYFIFIFMHKLYKRGLH